MSNSTPSPHTPIVPGSVLAGKYRVEKIIGQGGMGLVVEARHIALDERVALKFLLPEYSQHPEAAARFLREARAAVKIKSEHVARVSDVGTLDSGAPYMVMEFLEGADLSQTLEKLGVLRIEDAIDYITQGCEAIAEAHQHGIVHRDLKPANLFLSKRPDGTPIVKVLDFGISKVMGGAVDNLTKTTAAMGSALYMSPEQMQQTRAVDHRTDIYALGVALYELLAGKQPYYADTLPQLCAEILTGTPTPIQTIRPEVPEALAMVLEKAYARDKAHRYQSVADFVIALAAFAPARSQQTIDRVARMAGLAIPIAGDGGRASSPSSPTGPGGPRQGGTQILQQYDPSAGPAQNRQSSPGTMPLPAMDPTAGGAPPPGMHTQPGGPLIVPGHYQAPASSRASANFKQGNTTDAAMSAAGLPTSGGGSKAGVVVALVAVLALGGGAAAFFALKKPAPVAQPITANTGSPQPDKPVDPPEAKPPETGAPGGVNTVAPPATSTTAPAAVSVAEVPVTPGRTPGRVVGRPSGNGRVPVQPTVVTPVAPPATIAPPPQPPPRNPLEPDTRLDPLNPTKDRQK